MSDSDIVADLRECAADSRASEGDYYADQYATAPEIFEQAADEIERLRLTSDERQAIRWIVGDELSADGVNIQATLRGLLERHRATGSE